MQPSDIKVVEVTEKVREFMTPCFIIERQIDLVFLLTWALENFT